MVGTPCMPLQVASLFTRAPRRRAVGSLSLPRASSISYNKRTRDSYMLHRSTNTVDDMHKSTGKEVLDAKVVGSGATAFSHTS